MGQNIGTCVTALFSSIGASKMQKLHISFTFNVIGTIVFAVIGLFILNILIILLENL